MQTESEEENPNEDKTGTDASNGQDITEPKDGDDS